MKRLMLFVIILFTGMNAFGQSEELDMYAYLYNNAGTVMERLGILQSVAEAKIPGSGEFYAQALSRLVTEQPNLRNASERDASDTSVRLMAGLLGDEKYSGAAADLWRVVQAFSNPLVKADALIALGRLRAVEYLPQIVQLLSDTNLHPAADRDTGEKIAYGAIISLEKFADPSGYLPVFFASAGWYSRRIRDQAAASLPVIIADPSEPLSSVIRSSSYTYDVKHHALRTIEASDVDNQTKSAIALLAFNEGWRLSSNDLRQRMELANMRKQAITMIQKYGNTDASVYALLERSYKEGVDMEEKLGSVATLSVIGTEEAARLLSSFLMILNSRLQSGTLTREDEQLVRAVIPALGATGKALARPSLRAVQTLNWTNAVKTLATEALSKIQ